MGQKNILKLAQTGINKLCGITIYAKTQTEIESRRKTPIIR